MKKSMYEVSGGLLVSQQGILEMSNEVISKRLKLPYSYLNPTQSIRQRSRVQHVNIIVSSPSRILMRCIVFHLRILTIDY